MWSLVNNSESVELNCIATMSYFEGQSITAVDVAEYWDAQSTYSADLLAVGSEEGLMKIYKIAYQESGEYVDDHLVMELPLTNCHGSTVKRLKWQNSTSSSNENNVKDGQYKLVSVGQDNSVRIHNLVL